MNEFTIGSVGGRVTRKEIRQLVIPADATIHIQEGVVQIDENAFAGMQFESVIIPGSVARIEDFSFSKCNLKTIVCMKGVETIGGFAFNNCSKLERVLLPNSLKELSFSAFTGCSALRNIELSAGGMFKVQGSAVTTSDDRRLVGVIPGESLSIPPCVTSIAPYAFAAITTGSFALQVPTAVQEIDCHAFSCADGIESVAFNTNSSVKFGKYAFSDVKGLKRVILPRTSELSFAMFYRCRGLAEVVIQDGLTKVGRASFSDCKALKTVKLPDSVVEICEDAFDGCSKLREIGLPMTFAFSGDRAFSGCASLQAVALGNGMHEIPERTFQGCRQLKTITLPETLESIGKECFSGCRSLVSVAFPDGLKSIGEKAFSESGLESLSIPPQVAAVGDGAFVNCANLQSVLHSPTLCLREEETFAGCSKLQIVSMYGTETSAIKDHEFENRQDLETFHVPEGCVSIGERAFSGCKNLKSVFIPDSVGTIAQSAFKGCVSLNSVRLPVTLTVIEMSLFEGCENIRTIQIPEGVREIRRSAFSESGLISVAIPESVCNISNAFSRCYALADVKLPSGLVELGDGAFYGCLNLSKMRLPRGIKVISPTAFARCTSLVSFDVDAENQTFTSMGGLLLDDAGQELSLVAAGMEKVIVPDGVLRIRSRFNDSAFAGCTKLRVVEIVGGVTRIPDCTFQDCYSLEMCCLPKTLRIIGNAAFTNTTLHESTPLKAISIPEGVEVIGDYAFERSGLCEITIPSSVKRIGRQAFRKCHHLTQVKLYSGLGSIGEEAFSGSALREVIIPAGVSVEDDAFRDCAEMCRVVADVSDKKITKARCFPGCPKVRRIERCES